MPRRDGTGPMGTGPMTGRGFGSCCGGFGGGRGFGAAAGMGWGYRMTEEERKKMLKEQAEYLKEDLEAVKRELESLEK